MYRLLSESAEACMTKASGLTFFLGHGVVSILTHFFVLFLRLRY